MAGTPHADRNTSGDPRRVASAGLSLAVREYGAPSDASGAEHVVLVHGYPDNQLMWRPVARRLAGAGLHVVTYDVRGAGDSAAPAGVAGYRVALLVDDLVAVLDATVPGRDRVHLVGHDWGSVQLWEAVLAESEDPRLRGRIASFTSVSGPAMEHVSYLLRHPRGRELKVLRQLAHSWYVFAFQLPALPEAAWRAAGRLGLGHGPADDAARGVNLYRANLRRTPVRGAPRRTDVPVLVVAPRRDPFLTGVVVEELDRVATDARLERPDTGHWVPRTHPDLVADLVLEHVRAHP